MREYLANMITANDIVLEFTLGKSVCVRTEAGGIFTRHDGVVDKVWAAPSSMQAGDSLSFYTDGGCVGGVCVISSAGVWSSEFVPDHRYLDVLRSGRELDLPWLLDPRLIAKAGSGGEFKFSRMCFKGKDAEIKRLIAEAQLETALDMADVGVLAENLGGDERGNDQPVQGVRLVTPLWSEGFIRALPRVLSLDLPEWVRNAPNPELMVFLRVKDGQLGLIPGDYSVWQMREGRYYPAIRDFQALARAEIGLDEDHLRKLAGVSD